MWPLAQVKWKPDSCTASIDTLEFQADSTGNAIPNRKGLHAENEFETQSHDSHQKMKESKRQYLQELKKEWTRKEGSRLRLQAPALSL
jgi:hypothetical protein